MMTKIFKKPTKKDLEKLQEEYFKDFKAFEDMEPRDKERNETNYHLKQIHRLLLYMANK